MRSVRAVWRVITLNSFEKACFPALLSRPLACAGNAVLAPKQVEATRDIHVARSPLRTYVIIGLRPDRQENYLK
jgi:hypothetical protein